MKRVFLILIIAVLVTVFGEQMTTVAPTKAEIPEPPGFFSAAFSYLEQGLKKIFGFKEEDSRDNSTSTAHESHLIRALGKSTDRAEQLLGGGSIADTTVAAPVGVIVVKEDATTQKKS